MHCQLRLSSTRCGRLHVSFNQITDYWKEETNSNKRKYILIPLNCVCVCARTHKITTSGVYGSKRWIWIQKCKTKISVSIEWDGMSGQCCRLRQPKRYQRTHSHKTEYHSHSLFLSGLPLIFYTPIYLRKLCWLHSPIQTIANYISKILNKGSERERERERDWHIENCEAKKVQNHEWRIIGSRQHTI